MNALISLSVHYLQAFYLMTLKRGKTINVVSIDFALFLSRTNR